MRLRHLDSGIGDLDRRICKTGRLPQKHALALVAFDQFDPGDTEDRQDQPGKPGAAAKIDEAARLVRDEGQQLRRIEEMASPQIAERIAADEVDPPRPALEEL